MNGLAATGGAGSGRSERIDFTRSNKLTARIIVAAGETALFGEVLGLLRDSAGGEIEEGHAGKRGREGDGGGAWSWWIRWRRVEEGSHNRTKARDEWI